MSIEATEIVRRNEAIARFMGWIRDTEGYPWYLVENGIIRLEQYAWEDSPAFNSNWNLLMPVIEKISSDAEVHLAFRPMGKNLQPLCHASAGQKSIHSYMDGNLSPIEAIWRAVSDYCLSLEPSPAAGV